MAAPPTSFPPPTGFPSYPPPSSSVVSSNVVLLRNVPSFLNVREWVLGCGTSSRKVIDGPSISLVTMIHGGDGAVKLVCAVDHLSKLHQDFTLKAHLVPASPDVPLPTPQMDETGLAQISEQLWQLWVDMKDSKTKTATAEPATEQPKPVVTAPPDDDSRLDADKVKAAAGGAYDEDTDPLNAPHVLQAVKEFRAMLVKKDEQQKEKRIRVVADAIQNMMPVVKEQMRQQQQQRQHPPPIGLPPPGFVPSHMGVPPPLPPAGFAPGAPPPLPPTGLPPGVAPPLPPTGLPPPPPLQPPKESGRRGVSNLPAWMTAESDATEIPPREQPPPPPPTAGQPEGPPRKRPKLDLTEEATSFAKPPDEAFDELRAYITSQIVEMLGEEEKTLIEFCFQHVVREQPFTSLLEELQVVLDEDAPVFVEALKKKVLDMC